MKTYNRFMELFWLGATVLIFIVVTFMGIKEGFSTWAMYYGFMFFTLMSFVLRRFMRKRMEKHQAFLEQQQKQ